MIFETVEDDAKKSGIHIENEFKVLKKNIKEIFSKDSTLSVSFDKDFTSSLSNDIEYIKNFKAEVDSGTSVAEAMSIHLASASSAAKEYANSTNTANISTEEFVIKQKQAAVVTVAQSKSLTNARSIINSYNSGTNKLGMTTDQFVSSVSDGNMALGRYLSSLNGGKATVQGYIGSLIAAKAATIGLQIVTTAANAAISFGISIAIQGLITLVDNLVHREEKLIEKSEDAKNAIQSINDELKENSETVEETSERFAVLAQRVEDLGKLSQNKGTLSTDEYEEFLELSNQLAGVFPELTRGYDDNGNAILNLSGDVNTIVSSLDDLIDRQKQLANQEIIKQLPDLYSGFTINVKDARAEVKQATTEFNRINDAYSQLSKYGSMSFAFDVGGNYRDADGNIVDNINNIRGLASALGLVVKETQLFEEVNMYGAQRLAGTLLEIEGSVDDNFTSKLENARKDLQYAKHNLESELSSIGSYINTWLQGEWMYNKIDDTGLQSALQQMLLSFDPSILPDEVDSDNWEAVSEWIRKNILFAISNIDNEEVANALSELFSGDNLSIKELNGFADTLKSYFGEDSPVYLFIKPKLEDVEDANKYADSVKKFVKDEFDDKVGELSIGDLEIASKLEIPDGTLLSWDELVEKIKELKDIDDKPTHTLTDLSDALQTLKSNYDIVATAEKEMADDGLSQGLSPDTIKALADATDDYLDYLYEENGIIKLNTEAWKEQSNLEMENSINAIEDEIKALEDEKTALENAKVYEDEYTGSVEEGAYRQSDYTAAVEKNSDAIAENQTKLGLYEALYNNATGSLDAYTSALQNFTTVNDFISQMSDSLTTVADLQEEVANGFTLSLEKALEFASVYPEIMNGATVAADGQITLNENVVNAFIEGKEAELKAEVDSRVAELEAEKARLTAKMNFSQAELELAKSVGDGEGQISKELAEYRVNAGNAVTQALIAAGIDEATAYQLATAAMAQNSIEFDEIAKQVCTDVQGNFNQAAYDAAQSIYTNMQNSKISIASVAEQAHQAAIAIAGIGSGTVQGSSSVNGSGASGSYSSKGNISVTTGSFKGATYSYEAKTISLDSFISDLELDISSYSKAISQIDGQIATLKALRNTSLNKFSTSSKKASSGSGSGSSSSEKDDTPTWFETQYKLHKHLLAMEAEDESDYLDWLNSAYKQAYNEGIIELDDYYKYQEEVFSGLKDLFKDYLGDVEHEISMRKNYDGEAKKIISLYKTLISKVEAELQAAYARGLDDTDDYVQELLSKWQGYKDGIKDIQDDIEDNAKDAVDDLIDYVQDMQKQEIEDQKDALDKKLDNLKEFYDKQKEMLEDARDEEKYLDEQAEKRKSVTDIQAELARLEYDNSAWAQKRKAELKDELVDAQKELDEFEKDRALDLALDAIEESYNAQEAQIQAEMDALDAELNNPELMFNKALAAIQTNTGNLYQQMLEFNRKYGTGNDEDVKDKYEEAYKALLEYKKLNGKDYNGVTLTNATGYKSETGSYDSSKPKASTPTTTTTTKSTTPTTTTTPTLDDATKRKVAAAIWNGGYGWGTGSTRSSRLTEVFGSNNGIQALVNQNVGRYDSAPGDSYSYLNMRKKFKGYASGTKNALAGLAQINELGDEAIFQSKDGNTYKLFSGGEKVFNANATDFLYDFANGGNEILEKVIKSALGGGLFDKISPVVNNTEINMGDINIAGSANNQTVSEIRREQREAVKYMLTEFQKLNK